MMRSIFAHGWATDPWVWERCIDGLKSTDFINAPLPSHGARSRWGSADISPAVSELSGLMQEGKAHLGIGWSLGAMALLSLAVKRPEDFCGLVLVGATARFTKDEGYEHGQSRSLVRKMSSELKRDAKGALYRFYALNFTNEELRGEAAVEFIERYRYPGPIECDKDAPGCFPLFDYPGITNALDALGAIDIRDIIGLVRCPVLLIHGANDAVVPIGAAEALKDKIKTAELDVIDDAGHAPFLTQEGRVTESIKGFLKRL